MKTNSEKMLTKEFAKKVGLKDYQVKYYCDQGLLNPERTGSQEIGNDRRFFSEEDLIRMEQIFIFKHLGVTREKLKEVFASDDYDVNVVLDEAIAALKKRIRHDQNLLLVAQLAQQMGTSIFSFGSFTESDIDKVAEAIRSSSSFKLQRSILRKMDKADREALAEKLNACLFAIASYRDIDSPEQVPDSSSFKSVCDLVDTFCATASFETDSYPGLTPFYLGLSFMGDGELSAWANEIGGEESSEFCAIMFMLAWLKSATSTIAPLLIKLSNLTSDNPDFLKTAIETKLALEAQVPSELCIDLSISDKESTSFISMVEVMFDFMNDFLSDPDIVSLIGLDASNVPNKSAYQAVIDAIATLD